MLNIEKNIKDKRLNLKEGSVFRFPPEPNGYIHLGHVKSILLNYKLSKALNGTFNLRFDDTNPDTARAEYVNAIIDDLTWLKMKPDNIFFTSDYFDTLFNFALHLIKTGKAYVCSMSGEEMDNARREYLETKKLYSPSRDNSIDKNMELFTKMFYGELDGHVLRLKVEKHESNLHMLDPIIYKNKTSPHYKTKDKWKVYSTYDFAHPISDAIEGITHSLCTKEFEEHRPLYDYLVGLFAKYANLTNVPHQYEFSKLNISNAALSKRKLIALVKDNDNDISGFDDYRLLTVAGMRNRGLTPEIIKSFVEKYGFDTDLLKEQKAIDVSVFEKFIKNEMLKCDYPVVAGVPDDNKVKVLVDGKFNVFINKNDYRYSNEDKKDFLRLCIKQPVRIKNVGIVDVVSETTSRVLVKTIDGDGLKLKTIACISADNPFSLVIEGKKYLLNYVPDGIFQIHSIGFVKNGKFVCKF